MTISGSSISLKFISHSVRSEPFDLAACAGQAICVFDTPWIYVLRYSIYVLMQLIYIHDMFIDLCNIIIYLIRLICLICLFIYWLIHIFNVLLWCVWCNWFCRLNENSDEPNMCFHNARFVLQSFISKILWGPGPAKYRLATDNKQDGKYGALNALRVLHTT